MEPTDAQTRSKRRLSFIVRLLLAILLVALLVRIVEWPKLWGLFASVRPQYIVLALLVILAGNILKTYRWYVLLQTGKPRVPLWMLVKCNLISYFVGVVAPTNLTAEVVRVYYLTRGHADVKRSVSSILADRMVGSFSLGIATALAALWIGFTGLFPVGTPATLGIAGFLLLTILIPVSFLFRPTASVARRILDRLPDRTWPRRAKQMFESLVAYRDHGSTLASSLFVSFFVIFLGLTEFYLVAEGFSSLAPFHYFVLFMPIAFFLSMVPVSLGGFGLLETALVLFFTKVGLSLEICIAIVLVHKSLFLLTILPGAYFYVVEGFPKKRIPPQPVELEP